MPSLPVDRCRICALPLSGVQVCPSCYGDPPRFDTLHAAFEHDALARDLIHRLKYDGFRHLAEPLASAALEALPAWPSAADCVLPVPLHPGRRRARGFNQADLLAVHVAARLGVPIEPSGLARTRSTDPQTGLTSRERRANVRGAFVARADLAAAHVLLVDDVCTTGATLDACAAALRAVGVERIEAIVVSRSLTPL
jgi:ComF family protein